MLAHRRLFTPALLLACVMGAACTSPSHTTPRPPAAGGSGGGSAGSGGSGGAAGEGGTAGLPGGSTGGSGGVGGSPIGGGSGSAGSGGSAGDDAGSGGATGDAAAAPAGDGGPGALPGGTKVVYILNEANPGGSAGDPSRKSLVDLLNSMHDSHGIVVKNVDSPTPYSAMKDAALIIIGPNATMFEKHPAPDLKTAPVPLMVSKDGHTDEVGMGTVQNTEAIYDSIKIIKTDHPLAAGLPLGPLKVMTTTNKQRMIRFSNLGPDAIKIANGPADNNTFSIVGYEKGGEMANGFKAPAKRVGFFWHRPAAVTPEGAKLFKAAIDWLLRP
jgi:hypothetical protein